MKTKIFSALILLMFCLSIVSKAQNGTLYNMRNIPQSLQLNPAFQHSCKSFVEIPVLSALSFNLSIPFAYNDVIQRDAEGNIVYDIDAFEDNLKDVNYIETNQRFNALAFGFKGKNGTYFSFNISACFDTYLSFPKELLAFRKGNWDFETNKPISRTFNGLGVATNVYQEVGFAMSKKIDQQLTVGARLKYINGSANFTTESSNITFIADEITHNLNFEGSNMTFRTNAPIETFDTDDDGKPDSLAYVEGDYLENFLTNKCYGMGIDLGATYMLNPKVLFSASVIDLGFISWKSDYAKEYSGNTDFVYKGLDFSGFGAEDFDIEDVSTKLIDSLLGSFDYNEAQGNYTTPLRTRIFLGANYLLNKNLNVGILTQSILYDKKFHHGLTLSANANFWKGWAASISYSMMNKTYNNLGFGISFKGGPIQIYLISDKMPIKFVKETSTNFLIPYSTQNFNFRFGINLLFGCKDKVDVPSIYESDYF